MPALLAPLLLFAPAAVQEGKNTNSDAAVLAELDAFWAEASRTVAEGDFDGYAALYHPDAVLVNGIEGRSYPIADAFERWKPGFTATRAGSLTARVEFRLTDRLTGPTTAHEAGLFRYAAGPVGGTTPRVAVVRFEALLVKTGDPASPGGGWRWVMEKQSAEATEEDWAAAGSGGDPPGGDGPAGDAD